MRQISGFCIERKPSKIPGCGTGVIVTKGTVPKHAIVAMYPGNIPYKIVVLHLGWGVEWHAHKHNCDQ